MTILLGVDQTGAVDGKGRPKPLSAALLFSERSAGRLVPNVRLRSMRREDVEAAVGTGAERVLVIVDSVLGLPAELAVSPDELLRRAASFTFEHRAYGRTVAARFFASFLPGELQARLLARTARGHLPVRASERLAEANSVFLEHPFQRNVGCGSFRILKELGQDERWFSFWPRERWGSHRFLVAEGYPSLYWRSCLGAATRNPRLLETYLRECHPDAPHPKTADDADAVALVLGGAAALRAGALEAKLPVTAKTEGWILGLRPDPPANTPGRGSKRLGKKATLERCGGSSSSASA